MHCSMWTYHGDPDALADKYDTLWLRRAHNIGWRRQLLNLITYAMGVNAMSMHVHRQGLAPPIAA